jgi:polysaccharide export outer membrane protein
MRAVAVAACVFALALARVAAADPLPASAVLHPGDQLHVDVVGEPQLSQNVVVAQDGTIGLPMAGEVHVAGATPADASDAIASALARYIRHPQVTLAMTTHGSVHVMVLGDVVNSGEYALDPGAHLSDAIAAAGGMDPTIAGPYPVARVAEPGGTTYHVSLEALLRGGDPARDVPLTEGAAVYVPGQTTYDVTVLGAVDHPGTVTINDGDRLSIAIAKAGDDAASSADLTHVMVTRTEADGTTASHPIDLYKALENGDTRYDPLLRKGDVVYVPMAHKSGTNATNALFLLSHLFFL